MGALARPRIRDTGTPEAPWRRWFAQSPVPGVTLDRLLPASSRLVVVAPHPDDEVLGCGGLLGTHVARGGACAIVAVTDGAASHRNSTRWTPAELALTRRAESEQGLSMLGVSTRSVVRLGLPDGGIESSAAHLRSSLQKLLRRSDLVVATWQLDGHPDHEAVGRIAAQTASRAGARCIEAPVWMWHWSAPLDPSVPWHRLRRLALGKGMVRRKVAALLAHASQLTPREHGEGPVLDPAMLQRAGRSSEYFFV